MPHTLALTETLRQHLTTLVEQIGPRPTGSSGNQRAGQYLKERFAEYGWLVETPPFDCLTWEPGIASLRCDTAALHTHANPFSPPVEGTFPAFAFDSPEALEAAGSQKGRIVVLTGALSGDPFIPLNFPFVSFEEQQRVMKALIAAEPAAVIGIHPKPLFCDADFPIPSLTVDPSGAELLRTCRGELTIAIGGKTIRSIGRNVIARPRRLPSPKIILTAHYDTWFGTPGAVDNAAGVAVLLGAAALLDSAESPVEFVVFNGEDHYASPGEVQYFTGDLGQIALNVNVDGVGAQEHLTGAAYLGEAPALFKSIRAIQADFPSVVEGEPWYQSDHTAFLQRGIPALALTSTPFDAWLERTHTAADTLEGLDFERIAEAARFVARVVEDSLRGSASD
ncbi:MAG: M28 family peptidase [Anaerolineae bacterium]|nr:M28 family peptidase [Anaerolineae bacterium]